MILQSVFRRFPKGILGIFFFSLLLCAGVAHAATVVAPTFSPSAGTYTSVQTVTITSTTSGASIRYTIDGTTPSATAGTVYSAPVSIGATKTLKAIAYKSGSTNSSVTSGTYTINLPTAVAPAFSPVAGTFTSAQTVAITSTTSGASIRYTVDGTAPSATAGTVYSAPVSIGATTTLKAIAYKTGYNASAVTSGVYTINLPTAVAPTFSPVAGTYTSVQTVTISSATSGASIRYTTDGSTPTATAGTVYSAAVSVSATTTLKAIAYKTGYNASTVSSGLYTINLPTVVAPVFGPVAGTYTSAQTVAITSTTSGASIRYTTDGSTPTTTTGTLYTTSVSVGATTTLKAIAYLTGYNNSTVTSGTYTINIPQTVAPAFSPVAGTYTSIQTVAITSTTSGASIRYTTDGSTPTSTTGTFYSTPVSVAATITLKAIAYKSGYTDSSVTSGLYTINLPTAAAPSFNPVAGTYTSVQTVAITSSTSGAAIRYTIDGSTPTATTGTVYSTPVGIGVTTTLKAIAYNTGYISSTVTSGTYTINLTAAAPTFSPIAGTYTSSQTVALTSATGGASIRYTIDGTTPSATAGTLYTVPVSIGATTTLKAIAYATGYASSTVTSGTYTINLPTAVAPTFNPVAGSFTTAQSVTIATTTSNASIRYTTDGSTPSPTVGTVYSTPVSISATKTLKAIAYLSGYNNSSVASGTFTITLPTVAAPTFSPTARTYTSTQTVTITSSTSGATIRYTTDGSTPGTTTGAVYSGAITISTTTTLKAIAYLAGYNNSSVTSGVYTINRPTVAAPAFSPAAGIFTSAQTVTMSSSTYGATIRYTTDGSTPSATIGTIYSSPLNVGVTTTLKAIAYKTGSVDSSVASGDYIINLPAQTPIFTPAGDTYGSPQSVTIASANATAIYYTSDGSTPTSYSTLYTGPILVSADTTLQAIGASAGGTSLVSGASYVILPSTTAPVFSVASGYFADGQNVAITSATPGSTIRYTIDGSIPSENNGLVYAGPVSLTSTCILKAMAYLPGYFHSAITDGVYTIGSAAPILNALHDFSLAKSEGANPLGALIQGADGDFYGTTQAGGSAGLGTIFRVTPSGKLTTLVSFTGPNGSTPSAALVQGSNGNFYGTTTAGGSKGYGTIFVVTPTGTISTLVNSDGGSPYGSLLLGRDGNFYGMISNNSYIYGAGEIFKMTPAGVLTNIGEFSGSPSGLVLGSDGNFYGSTYNGGSFSYTGSLNGSGTIFKMSPNGIFTTLFVGGGGVSNPAGLLEGKDGNFYFSGWRINDCACVYMMTPAGWVTPLGAVTYGNTPSLTLGIDSNIYGVTPLPGSDCEMAFKVIPERLLTPLAFFNTLNGSGPYGSMVQGNDGNLYGMTAYGGGSTNDGVVYQLILKAAATPIIHAPPSQPITITSDTVGAVIRYTIDGSVPTQTDGYLYTGPINLSAPFVLKAIAYRPDLLDSGVARLNVALPNLSDFEAKEGYALGSLDQQLGWGVASGNAQIVSGSAAHGSQYVTLSPGATATIINQEFNPALTNSAIQYVDFYAKPVAGYDVNSGSLFDLDAARIAFILNGASGQICALDGDGGGNGTWKLLGPAIPLTTDNGANVAASWHRITVRLNYTFTVKTYDLYFDGVMIGANLKFRVAVAPYFSWLSVKGAPVGSVAFDCLLISSSNPLFDDANDNGIADDWEVANGFSLTSSNRDDDPDRDGLTNVQEYCLGSLPTPDSDGDGRTDYQEIQAGTDPHDYYNGAAPPAPVVVIRSSSSSFGSLEWTPLPKIGPALYQIERRTGAGSFTKIGEVGQLTSYTDYTTSDGLNYTYRVRVSTTGAWSDYSNEQSLTTPILPKTGLKLWLDANTCAAGPVSSWAGRNGSTAKAQQAMSQRQPVAVPGVLNGNTIVRFDGVDDSLNLVDIMNGATSGEIFGVVSVTTLSGTVVNRLWSFGTGSGSSYFNGSRYEDFGTNEGNPHTGSSVSNQYHIANVSLGNGVLRESVNGVVNWSREGAAVAFNSAPEIGGSLSDANTVFKGDIAEIFVYDRELSSDERLVINAYLADKYMLGSVPVPVAPRLSAKANTNKQVILSWSAPPAELYTTTIIERSTDNGPFTALAQMDQGTTYVDSPVLSGGYYSYRIRSKGLRGVSEYSNVVSLIVPVSSTIISTASGSSLTALAGNWAIDGTSLVAQSIRGTLGFSFAVDTAGLYALNINMRDAYSINPASEFVIEIILDDISLTSLSITASGSMPGTGNLMLPWLTTGSHTVKIVWQNGNAGTLLRVDSVQLASLDPTDANNNGEPDWIAPYFASTFEFDGGIPVQSYVSPYTVEGKSAYPLFVKLNSIYQTTPVSASLPLTVHQGLSTQFFADVALHPTAPTSVTALEANGTRVGTKVIVWRPYNLASGTNASMIVRKDSRVLVEAFNLLTPNATYQLKVIAPDGVIFSQILSSAQQLELLFDQVGDYRLFLTPDGGAEVEALTVTVRQLTLSPAPVLFSGRSRTLAWGNLPPGPKIQTDPTLSVVSSGTASPQMFTVTANTASRAILRLDGENSPIVDAITVEPIRSYNDEESTALKVGVLPDGTAIYRFCINLKGVISADLCVDISTFTGATFSDGSIEKTLTVSDFDSDGRCIYYLYVKNGGTSTCHHLTICNGSGEVLYSY